MSRVQNKPDFSLGIVCCKCQTSAIKQSSKFYFIITKKLKWISNQGLKKLIRLNSNSQNIVRVMKNSGAAQSADFTTL